MIFVQLKYRQVKTGLIIREEDIFHKILILLKCVFWFFMFGKYNPFRQK